MFYFVSIVIYIPSKANLSQHPSEAPETMVTTHSCISPCGVKHPPFHAKNPSNGPGVSEA